MKAVVVLCLALVAMSRAQNNDNTVRVVDNPDPSFGQPTYNLQNVDSGFYRPTVGNPQNIDAGFYRPTVGNPQNIDAGFYRPTIGNPPYQPISTGPEFVNGPYQNGPPGYPYRNSNNPNARGGRK